jgi:hypothetical protein
MLAQQKGQGNVHAPCGQALLALLHRSLNANNAEVAVILLALTIEELNVLVQEAPDLGKGASRRPSIWAMGCVRVQGVVDLIPLIHDFKDSWGVIPLAC